MSSDIDSKRMRNIHRCIDRASREFPEESALFRQAGWLLGVWTKTKDFTYRADAYCPDCYRLLRVYLDDVKVGKTKGICYGCRDMDSHPTDVYLIHFPDDAAYKVGISKSGAAAKERIRHHVKNGGTHIQSITVDNRQLARRIEQQILREKFEGSFDFRVQFEHRRGATEMWPESGGRVDLAAFARAVQIQITERPLQSL